MPTSNAQDSIPTEVIPAVVGPAADVPKPRAAPVDVEITETMTSVDAGVGLKSPDQKPISSDSGGDDSSKENKENGSNEDKTKSAKKKGENSTCKLMHIIE